MSVAVTAALLPAQATGTIVIATAMTPIGWELSASTKRDSSAADVVAKYCTTEENAVVRETSLQQAVVTDNFVFSATLSGITWLAKSSE